MIIYFPPSGFKDFHHCIFNCPYQAGKLKGLDNDSGCCSTIDLVFLFRVLLHLERTEPSKRVNQRRVRAGCMCTREAWKEGEAMCLLAKNIGSFHARKGFAKETELEYLDLARMIVLPPFFVWLLAREFDHEHTMATVLCSKGLVSRRTGSIGTNVKTCK